MLCFVIVVASWKKTPCSRTTEFYASFSVDDIGVAKEFYAGTLGLEVWETDADSQWLREFG